MKTKNTNRKKSIKNKAVKTIDKSRNIWKNKFYESQEELRKANVSIETKDLAISLYQNLWKQAEERIIELKAVKDGI